MPCYHALSKLPTHLPEKIANFHGKYSICYILFSLIEVLSIHHVSFKKKSFYLPFLHPFKVFISLSSLVFAIMFSASNFSSSPASQGFLNKRIITGVLVKQFDSETLGIGFREEKDGVVLGKITSRFEKETDLVSGLKVLHINGTPVESATQAAMLIRSVGAGEAVIVAVDGMCLKATKKWRADKTGICLESCEDGIRISQVTVKGYFPSLQPGQKLVSINGILVRNLQHAQNLLANNKTLSLVVVTDDEESLYSSSRSLNSYSPSSSVSDELDLFQPVHFQMQDFEEEEGIAAQ